MNAIISDIPTARQEEISRIINRCTTLTPDLQMAFYLPPITDIPPRRYSLYNPAKQLELILITKKECTEDQLLYDWIIYDATKPINPHFDRNLLILSEDEFIHSFNDLNPFRERVLSGMVVFDRDGEFLFV